MTVGLRLQHSGVQSPFLIALRAQGLESPDWSISPLQSSALSPDQALGHRGMSVLNVLWYDVLCYEVHRFNVQLKGL